MKIKTVLLKITAVISALGVWQLASFMIKGGSTLLASPIDVAKRFVALPGQSEFLSYIWFSFSKIALGFILALLLGTALASLAGRFETFALFMRPYMLTVRSVPVASFIVLALIWLTSSSLSVFISFLMVLPIIYTNVLEGIRSADEKLKEAADVFRVTKARRILYIYIPAVRPFLVSACKISLGMAWKSGIAAEVIGIADGSIGEKLYYAKVYLDSAELLAWTAVIVLLSMAFEKLFLFALNKVFDRLKKV